MNSLIDRLSKGALKNTSFILFVALFVVFGMLTPRFFSARNFEIILSNASYVGIIAVGMTFVLLTGGIDLSVGAVMYLSAVVIGHVMNEADLPVGLGIFVGLSVGLAVGAFNALLITGLKVVPFITTMVSMIACRGLGLLITKSVQVDFESEVTMMATVRVGGLVQLNVFIYFAVVLTAALFLGRTATGRRIYAVGNDLEAAKKAGLKTRRIIASTYMVSGICAALGGYVSIAQVGRVATGFGEGVEFSAIAASVLGGASLFGGVGHVFPGTVLGTVMIQMIQAGLVFSNVDLYIQPIIMAFIIFFAVSMDSFRNMQLKKLERRNIMKVEA